MGRGRVKTQNRSHFRGAKTIPNGIKIEYSAIVKVEICAAVGKSRFHTVSVGSRSSLKYQPVVRAGFQSYDR
jgi:AMMECR1 domain-containing protein